MGLTRIRAEQISDIDYKQAVRVVQITNVTLTGGAPSAVDGVNLSANDRILVTGQSTGSQNGMYRVQTLGTGANGTWVRTSDGNTDGEIEAGMIIMVTEGENYADTQWKLTTNNPIIIGTTPLTFVLNAVSVIGGENTQVQYNSGGVLAGSANLTFDGTSLTVGGNVTANYFLGDGSQLSGIITSVANINNGTSNVSIDTANANVTVGINGTANVVVISTGLLTADGNVSANYFLGNGSQLTGIDAGPVTTVGNTAPVTPAQGDIWINSDTGSQYIYFSSGGNSQWAEMEADQSFSSGGSEVDLTAVNTDILPTANITYDIGNTTNRFRDIYLANSTIYLGEAQISATGGAIVLPAGTTIGGSAAEVPKIGNIQITDSSWTVLDDTAISTDGGYFIVNGTGFQSGATVSVDGTAASSVSFVNSTLLRCQIGAKAANSYTVYVVNPDGGTALKIAGLTYSGTPAWVTAGQLANAVANAAFTYTLEATGATSYALAAGNSIPTGSNLAANGVFSGNVAVNTNTNYTFTVVATDAELQDSNRTFNLNVNLATVPPEVEYLVVAGGGGGGGWAGGGGGAGGFRTGTGFSVTAGNTYTITVGAGGTGQPAGTDGAYSNGSNSVFSTITATGGGRGGNYTGSGLAGQNGGSGGGGSYSFAGGTGNTPSTSPSQGNNGGAATTSQYYGGGGGGGASAMGGTGGTSVGGSGGNGTASSISGSSVTYAGGGGGGGGNSSVTGGTGGTGGGGNGGNGSPTTAGSNGTANTGGGGGGAGSSNTTGLNHAGGGAGGSGIVIIRYPDSFLPASSTTGSPEVTTAGGYRVYKFTGSGSITW